MTSKHGLSIPPWGVVILHIGVWHNNYITCYLGYITVQEKYGQCGQI